MNLIEAKHISKQFVVQRDWLGRPKKTLTAVDDLSLTIGQGETVGLVGESGCGKSTFARTLLGLYAKTGGSITYKGRDIADRAVGRDYRRHVQMIFQDPYASLDPRMTVEDIISEPMPPSLRGRQPLPSRHRDSAHPMTSGGQRQRC